MPREVRAYLSDVIAACDAIALDISGIDLDFYLANREKRSAVEREFIIIGEAVNALSDVAPELFARIGQARKIVDFRNQLTHGYAIVNDRLVWGYAIKNAPELRTQCAALLDELALGGAD
jgi:uncharacterized protein with HEPN domain